ncbi:MAG: hypothetical protein K0R21_1893 [Anaerocolumna sp.]|nr:hypothetical protein [Anaerocolumna sp.]
MKKRIWNSFEIYEADALAEHLETMAERGWMLDSIKRTLVFKRIEPQKIKFSVDIMENASVFDSFHNKKTMEYREFCTDTGWEHLSTNGIFHIFYSKDVNVIPIHTDQEVQFNVISKNMLGKTIPSYLYPLLMTIFFLFINANQSITSLTMNLTLISPVAFLFADIISIIMLLSALVWYLRGKSAIKNKTLMPKHSIKHIRIRSFIIMLMAFMILFATAFFLLIEIVKEPIIARIILPLILMNIVTFIVVVKVLTILQEKYNFTRNINRSIYVVTGIVLTVVTMVAVMYSVFSGIGHNSSVDNINTSMINPKITSEDFGYVNNKDIDWDYTKSIIASIETYLEIPTSRDTIFSLDYEFFQCKFQFGVDKFIKEKAEQLQQMNYILKKEIAYDKEEVDSIFLYSTQYANSNNRYIFVKDKEVLFLEVTNILDKEQLATVIANFFGNNEI